MKRNRIGKTEVDTSLFYWSGGKESHELRKNEITLYALIDLAQEEANIAVDDAEVQKQYNLMDMYYAALQLVEVFGEDTDLLQAGGSVLGNMIANGDFSKTYENLNLRNEAVNDLVNELAERTFSFNETTISAEFNAWFAETVLDTNHYCDPITGTTSQKQIPRTAIGTTYGYDYYSAKAKESGHFWLYSVADRMENEPDKVIQKRLQHLKYINWFEGAQTGLSRASIIANAKAGIIAKSGTTPNENLKAVINGDGTPKVGIIDWVIVIPLIVKAIVALTGLVVAVAGLVAAWKGKDITFLQQQPSQSELQGNAPTTDDWYNYANSQTSGTDSIVSEAVKSPLVWIGLGLLVVSLMS